MGISYVGRRIVNDFVSPQFLSVAAGFERDSPRNGENGVLGGCPTIPADCRPPASEKVHAEIPTANGTIITSIPEDTTSLVMPQEVAKILTLNLRGLKR